MDQELALEIMLDGHNVFLTGPAGAGKTYTLNEFVRLAKKSGKKVAVTATTGIAATHLNGNTIHAWSGLGVLDNLPRYFFDKLPKGRREQIEKADILIIDEISMLHDYRLDLIDTVCRTVRGVDESFGGLQVVFCGDFFQLPPVTRSTDRPEFDDEIPRTEFAYNALSWQNADPVILYLDSQHRQNDDEFLEILGKIRRDEIVRSDAEKIAKRFQAELDDAQEITELHTTNRDVDSINDRKMNALPGDFLSFEMSHTGSSNYVDRLKKSCLAPEILRLKKGALVMALKNDPEQGFVNGSIGVITGFGGPFNNPIVEFRNGRKITVHEVSWELRDGDKKRASITQIPLRPAYAITVHKSQGMTLDSAKINLKNVFEPGMGYVALSRVRSLNSLSILGLHSNAFKIHPEVLEHDQKFRQSAEIAKNKYEYLRVNKQRREKSARLSTKKKTSNPNSDFAKRQASDRAKWPNAWTKWKPDDDATLQTDFKSGKNIDQLVKTLGRSPVSVALRIQKFFGENSVDIEKIRAGK
ncbi:PIF1 family DEAD/DEAH box helicase [Candidatus Saccharibacteria bacterium]|nr:PIF1 family DEAD/DEAH box helicase [Candidatus Saccharibacteria bacterium]